MSPQSSRRNRSRYAIEYLFIPFLGSLLAVLVMEGWGGRASGGLVPPWETMPGWAIAMNVVVLWVAAVFVGAITCRPRLALLATVDAYGLLFLLHSWKLAYVKAPLLVTDVLGWHNVLVAALRYLSWGDAAALAVLVGIPFVTLAFPVIFPPFPGTKLFHIGLTLVTAGFFSTFLFPQRLWEPKLAAWGRVQHEANPAKEVEEDGLLLKQVLSWPLLRLGKPSPYGVTPIGNVVRPFREVAQSATAEEPVDVVVLVVDGLADPMRWKNPPLEDPIPRWRAESAQHASGTVSLPTLDGEGGRLEFELLTGFPTALLPTPSAPYQRYVHRNLDALPRVFARYGYRTVVMRPDAPWLLGRAQTYPQLGFAEFQSSLAGGDGKLVDALIQELDPVAAHFVVAFTNGAAAGETREAWLGRLRSFDENLGRLFESLRTRARRTLLVVLGTGGPALPDIASDVPDFDERLRAPILLWTNYPRAREAIDVCLPFLGASLLEWASVPSTPLFRFERAAAEKIAVLRSDVLKDRNGNAFPNDGTRWQSGTHEVFPWVRSLWLLEYDQLFGDGLASPPPDAFATKLPPTPTAAGVKVIEADTPPPTPSTPPAPSPSP